MQDGGTQGGLYGDGGDSAQPAEAAAQVDDAAGEEKDGGAPEAVVDDVSKESEDAPAGW